MPPPKYRFHGKNGATSSSTAAATSRPMFHRRADSGVTTDRESGGDNFCVEIGWVAANWLEGWRGSCDGSVVWARAMRGRALDRPVGVSPRLSLTMLPLNGVGNRLWAQLTPPGHCCAAGLRNIPLVWKTRGSAYGPVRPA